MTPYDKLIELKSIDFKTLESTKLHSICKMMMLVEKKMTNAHWFSGDKKNLFYAWGKLRSQAYKELFTRKNYCA